MRCLEKLYRTRLDVAEDLPLPLGRKPTEPGACKSAVFFPTPSRGNPCRQEAFGKVGSGFRNPRERLKRDPAEHPGSVGAKDF